MPLFVKGRKITAYAAQRVNYLIIAGARMEE